MSEKIPVSGEELGLYLYEKYKADEPDPLGLSDLEKKLENKEKELKRAGDPRVMEAYAGLSEVSDALNALNMMASTAAYHNMKRILNANTLGGRMEEICEEAGLLKEKLEGNQPENLPSLLKNAKNLSAEYQSLIYNAGIADFQQKLGKNIPWTDVHKQTNRLSVQDTLNLQFDNNPDKAKKQMENLHQMEPLDFFNQSQKLPEINIPKADQPNVAPEKNIDLNNNEPKINSTL